jgi:hypothetical protein
MFGVTEEKRALDSSASLVKSVQIGTFMGQAAGARSAQTNLEWNSCRVIGQSSSFLTTPEASRLALACRDLSTFLEHVAAEGGLWTVCRREERAQFRRGLIWLHPIASLRDTAQFAMLAQSLRLGGGATFTDQNELRSLTRILQIEDAYASRVGGVADTFHKRFLCTWKFDPERIADLLENRSLMEVVSGEVSFTCRYGISFALSMSVSKASFQTPELMFRFNPVKMIGECRSSIEIKACGSVVAPDPQRSIVRFTPVFGGTRLPQSPTIVENEFDDADPSFLDRECSTEWFHFSRLLSVVRVHMFPVSLCVAPIKIHN